MPPPNPFPAAIERRITPGYAAIGEERVQIRPSMGTASSDSAGRYHLSAMVRALLFVLSAAVAEAASGDAKVDTLRATLAAMHGTRMQNIEKGAPRGATPQLTAAKHQLRDWVESRLPELAVHDNPGALEAKLNADLRAAGLIFDRDRATGSDPWSIEQLGYLNPIRVQTRSGFLVVITSLGIQCGEDDSAYIYGWSTEGWQRVWQNEQNDYAEKGYKPQRLSDVVISPGSLSNNYIALTLGAETWCASTWHEVYYRAFRLGGDPMARPLLDGSAFAKIDFDPPIHGSVTSEDVLVEYYAQSIDGGVLIRPHVRHYRLEDWQAKRVAPLALRPRDFVDEWLTHDWSDAAFWSEDGNRKAAGDWHTKLHKENTFGEFLYPAMHCPATPDLWQVGVDFSNPPTPIGQPPKGVYFMVRWRPPYIFSMVSVSDRPTTGCTEADRSADDELRTLFR